jgi:hypothetical protein
MISPVALIMALVRTNGMVMAISSPTESFLRVARKTPFALKF